MPDDRYTSVPDLVASLAGHWSGKLCPECGAELLTYDEDDFWCSATDCDYGLVD